MRIFVIGDIHGCLKQLQNLIKKLNLQKGDILIFLGDYMDGWSESSQIIHFLMELSEKQECIFSWHTSRGWCSRWPETYLRHKGRNYTVCG